MSHDRAAGPGADKIPPHDKHRRPAGASDETVAAVGKLTEGLERIERARGRLYDFHQLIGSADKDISDAADLLDMAGHTKEAEHLRQELVGRNVLPGRWTFQVIEEFDDVYYNAVKKSENMIRDNLLQGRSHIYESEMKAQNRTHGKYGHEDVNEDMLPTGD